MKSRIKPVPASVVFNSEFNRMKAIFAAEDADWSKESIAKMLNNFLLLRTRFGERLEGVEQLGEFLYSSISKVVKRKHFYEGIEEGKDVAIIFDLSEKQDYAFAYLIGEEFKIGEEENFKLPPFRLAKENCWAIGTIKSSVEHPDGSITGEIEIKEKPKTMKSKINGFIDYANSTFFWVELHTDEAWPSHSHAFSFDFLKPHIDMETEKGKLLARLLATAIQTRHYLPSPKKWMDITINVIYDKDGKVDQHYSHCYMQDSPGTYKASPDIEAKIVLPKLKTNTELIEEIGAALDKKESSWRDRPPLL